VTLPVERTATEYYFAADGQGVITIASCLDQSKRSTSTTVLCNRILTRPRWLATRKRWPSSQRIRGDAGVSRQGSIAT